MKKTLLALLIAIPSLLHAQYWIGDSALNNVVAGTSASGTKNSLATAKDQQNNVFVVWVDSRNTATTGNDIYIQKINKDGSMAWTANGIPVCNATGAQSAPAIVADGNNGVIVTWSDGRGANTQIYTQRIDANGNALYTNNGVQLVSVSANQTVPTISMVNSTEAMIFFRDARNASTGTDLFIHKINIATGATVWTSDVNVVAAANTQTAQSLLPDGAGGAYLAWGDPRSGTSNSDIFVQRVDNSGNLLWTANGVNITPSIANNQNKPTMAIDDVNGGFFITWQDLRTSSTDGNIYAQKVNTNGSVAWTAGGVLICNSANTQDYPVVVSDAAGGAIVAWLDPRDGTSARKIFAQRVNDSGAIQWASNGVNLASSQIASNSDFLLIKGKNAGTAIAIWSDTRNTAATSTDIYAQKLNDDGTRNWNDAGLIIANASGVQSAPVAETDGLDNVIVAWPDGRSGTASAEIYASNILSTGVLPVTYTGIQAKRSLSSIVVTWDVASEVNTVKYVVQRSAEDRNFVEIGSVQASKKSKYNFNDVNPLSGNNYYRVVGIDADGTLSYSDVTQEAFSLNGSEVQVYPNPVTAELKIKLNQIFTDKLYNFTLTDITGKVQFSVNVNGKNLQNIYPINVSNLRSGMYFVTIKQGNEKVSYPVVKN